VTVAQDSELFQVVAMDFAVVEFTKDSSVEVVPTVWLNDQSTLCYWPPYKPDRFAKSVKKAEPPQEHWESHAVRVLHLYGKTS